MPGADSTGCAAWPGCFNTNRCPDQSSEKIERPSQSRAILTIFPASRLVPPNPPTHRAARSCLVGLDQNTVRPWHTSKTVEMVGNQAGCGRVRPNRRNQPRRISLALVKTGMGIGYRHEGTIGPANYGVKLARPDFGPPPTPPPCIASVTAAQRQAPCRFGLGTRDRPCSLHRGR